MGISGVSATRCIRTTWWSIIPGRSSSRRHTLRVAITVGWRRVIGWMLTIAVSLGWARRRAVIVRVRRTIVARLGWTIIVCRGTSGRIARRWVVAALGGASGRPVIV